MTAANLPPTEEEVTAPAKAVKASKSMKPMNVCMLVVGTHGDVLPFLAIAEVLIKDGHRVRVATHELFRDQVTSRGCDFYPIGADPLQMSEFMVKHKSLMISNPLKAIPALNDLPQQLRLAKDIIKNSWPAVCSKGFVAEAIIANPICWAHVHVAEKLDVPLHIMFPQPWLPTRDFPHPYSGWKFGGPPSERNVYSFNLMDSVMWLPIHFAINKFRQEVLGIRTLSLSDGMAGLLKMREIPHSFLWSEALVPFPKDWPAFADIVGCIHNPPEPNYVADKKLAKFLQSGAPPILVTFGSMRIQRPSVLGQRIAWAAKKTGLRVLVQSGWSDLSKGVKKDPLLMFIRACPHTWLLPHVAAAVHHGGAGTTHACALAGKPMLVCPFFGDQPFWGEAIHKTGAGLPPVPIDKLSQEKLAEAFQLLVSGDMRAAAEGLAVKMKTEDGAAQAAKSFYRGMKQRKDRLARNARKLGALRKSLSFGSTRTLSPGGKSSTGSAPWFRSLRASRLASPQGRPVQQAGALHVRKHGAAEKKSVQRTDSLPALPVAATKQATGKGSRAKDPAGGPLWLERGKKHNVSWPLWPSSSSANALAKDAARAANSAQVRANGSPSEDFNVSPALGRVAVFQPELDERDQDRARKPRGSDADAIEPFVDSDTDESEAAGREAQGADMLRASSARKLTGMVLRASSASSRKMSSLEHMLLDAKKPGPLLRAANLNAQPERRDSDASIGSIDSAELEAMYPLPAGLD